MAEELKDLIEKIQQEGVKAAEDKAKAIEDQARSRARDIVEKAEKEASGIVAEARERVAKMETSQNASLRQAGRNLMLALRKEINSMLGKIVALRVREALKPDELTKILTNLIKDYSKKADGEVIISLKKDDLEKVEKAFLSELKEEIKKRIVLRQAEDVLGGFIISYDGGKSHYDFTDIALAEYITSYLNPKLADLLKEAASGDKK